MARVKVQNRAFKYRIIERVVCDWELGLPLHFIHKHIGYEVLTFKMKARDEKCNELEFELTIYLNDDETIEWDYKKWTYDDFEVKKNQRMSLPQGFEEWLNQQSIKKSGKKIKNVWDN